CEFRVRAVVSNIWTFGAIRAGAPMVTRSCTSPTKRTLPARTARRCSKCRRVRAPSNPRSSPAARGARSGTRPGRAGWSTGSRSHSAFSLHPRIRETEIATHRLAYHTVHFARGRRRLDKRADRHGETLVQQQVVDLRVERLALRTVGLGRRGLDQ